MQRPSSKILVTVILLLAGACAEDAPESPPGSTRGESEAESPGTSRRPDDPPTAQRNVVDEFRLVKQAPRHVSDGGGRAWLAPESPSAIPVASPGSWTIVYAAGEHGIAVGGTVRFLVSPFWEWSPLQMSAAHRPGYTTVETDAEGLELETRIPGAEKQRWLHIIIGGRPMAAGEELRITYGAGEIGARSDPYVEDDSRFWVAVDGDGDGFHRILVDSPSVRITAGPARRLQLTVPSTARTGQTVTARLALLDPFGNTGVDFEGTLEILAVPETIRVPRRIEMTRDDEGRATIEITPEEPGVYRLLAQALAEGDGQAIVAESNPILVEESSPRILWGDLHGHTNLTDGTGTPDAYYEYARDVAGLDVAALTDHDHWGLLFLDEHPDLWESIKASTRRFHDPGKFVTLHGFEWTSWIHGHRHVLYFEDDGPLISSVDEEYETPAQLWDALRGLPALTFAHHSAGGPIATNWDYPPDPELEPLTEVASVHGSSEAPDSPRGIYRPLAGNYVRDALDRGYKLGFIGSGDSHDGHPGLVQLAGGTGGLAAIVTDDLSREGVKAAMQARRVYATNGPRIILRCALDGNRMGSNVPPSTEGAKSILYVRAIGQNRLARVDVIRGGQVAQQSDLGDEEVWDLTTAFELENLRSGEYVYVRVVQAGSGVAWSSPFYVD